MDALAVSQRDVTPSLPSKIYPIEYPGEMPSLERRMEPGQKQERSNDAWLERRMELGQDPVEWGDAHRLHSVYAGQWTASGRDVFTFLARQVHSGALA
jgi:hypothetical protein